MSPDPVIPVFADRTLLVVVAHPDDETLFSGSQLAHCRKLFIVHMTDGAESARSARSHGFSNRKAYAAARRLELHAALSAGDVVADLSTFDYRDQKLSFFMADAALRLTATIDRTHPDIVLTHAYEGGHPDHDATSLIVHQAVARAAGDIPVWEFAGYNRMDGVAQIFAFAPHDPSAIVYTLTEEARRRKRLMLRGFVTQRALVEQIPIEKESFRPSPCYDYTLVPAADRAEGRNGLLSPARVWCRIAAQAIADLRSDPPRTRPHPLLRLTYRVVHWLWRLDGCPYTRAMRPFRNDGQTLPSSRQRAPYRGR